MDERMEQAHKLEKMREIIDNIKIAMMTTTELDGDLASRPMAVLRLADNGDLYFFTDVTTMKNAEIKHMPVVNLAFASMEKNSYLSVTGSARIVRDVELNKELWNIAASAWFPNGADDPNLRVIIVSPTQAQYWEGSSSKVIQLFKMVKGAITKGGYDGENERISFD